MIQYFCDRCGQQFGGPLDQVTIVDGNGVTTVYDLCAPCRQELKDTDIQTKQDFVSSLMTQDEIVAKQVNAVNLKGIKNG